MSKQKSNGKTGSDLVEVEQDIECSPSKQEVQVT